MLRVLHVDGESTRFFVESNHLRCLSCNKIFRRYKQDGQPCPKCGGQLEVRFHLVDIGAFDGLGQCSCEHFEFKLHKLAVGATLQERRDGKYRCAHIDAARGFCLDVLLAAHEHDRHRKARGQREEAA